MTRVTPLSSSGLISKLVVALSLFVWPSGAFAENPSYKYLSHWKVLERIEKGKPVAICTIDDWSSETSGHPEVTKDFIVKKGDWESSSELVWIGGCHLIALSDSEKSHIDLLVSKGMSFINFE